MSASSHYHGDRGTAYHESQHVISPTVRGQLGARKIARHLPAEVGKLLDFGCGVGAILQAMPVGEQRIGVDPIAENRNEVQARGWGASASLDDVADGWADAVISNHALEHTLDPLGALRDIHRVLRPGGTLVIYVPADDWRHNRAYNPSERNHHLFTWTPLALGHLLTEAGFTVREAFVHRYSWPGRLTVPLAKTLPARQFDQLAAVTALMLRRREIAAVATRD